MEFIFPNKLGYSYATGHIFALFAHHKMAAPMVTLIIYFYYYCFLGHISIILVDVVPYIWSTAANGLSIPYRGYIKADVTMFDNSLNMWVSWLYKTQLYRNGRKRDVPGVTCANIAQNVKNIMQTGHGNQNCYTWAPLLALYQHAYDTAQGRYDQQSESMWS